MYSTSPTPEQVEVLPPIGIGAIEAHRGRGTCGDAATTQSIGEPYCETVIETPLGDIEYNESGRGPTVVLAPGSCSTGAAWRPIVAHLKDDFRCVTTSLLGYGRTAERRTTGDADIAREADVLEAVIIRAGGPVHLVGHSFGGLTALAVALRKRVPLLSLMIIEAPAPEVLQLAREEQHYQAFQKMTKAYFGAFEAGEAAAIESMIDFYGGPGTFAAWPARVQAYALQTTATNIRDWEAAYRFPLSLTALADVEIPTLVVRGGASHPAIQCANELIARNMANASVMTLAGAAHFMISTHPREVSAMIVQHCLPITGPDRGRGESVRPPFDDPAFAAGK